jgi:hypothetical protein
MRLNKVQINTNGEEKIKLYSLVLFLKSEMDAVNEMGIPFQRQIRGVSLTLEE